MTDRTPASLDHFVRRAPLTIACFCGVVTFVTALVLSWTPGTPPFPLIARLSGAALAVAAFGYFLAHVGLLTLREAKLIPGRHAETAAPGNSDTLKPIVAAGQSVLTSMEPPAGTGPPGALALKGGTGPPPAPGPGGTGPPRTASSSAGLRRPVEVAK